MTCFLLLCSKNNISENIDFALNSDSYIGSVSHKIFYITHINKISITCIVYFLCSNHRKYKVLQEAKSLLSQYSAPNNIHNKLSYEFLIFLSIFHVYIYKFFHLFPKKSSLRNVQISRKDEKGCRAVSLG